MSEGLPERIEGHVPRSAAEGRDSGEGLPDMSARTAADRAAVWLGVASLASLIFLVLKRELHFVLIPQAGIAVAIVLGLLAIAGGWLRARALVLVAGVGFLAAAIAQVVLQTNGSSLATNSNGSTFGLWLGLGFGLLAVALTRANPTP